MYCKYLKQVAGVSVLLLGACTGGDKVESDTESPKDTVFTDSALTEEDDLQEELYTTSAGYSRVDELFDDFIYTFSRSPRLQKERTDVREKVDFSFMCGDFSTNLFSRKSELKLNEDTTLKDASVERIDFCDKSIEQYFFNKIQGKWHLTRTRLLDFDQSDMDDFLEFYSLFSTDSAFQERSLAKSIRISMLDPDNDDQTLDGTIEASQWPTVCSEVPQGILTNIRYGQHYHGSKRMMLEKVSMGGGMAETYTFEKMDGEWKLTGYDN